MGWVCRSLRGGGLRAFPPPSHQARPPAAGRTRRTGLPRDPDRTRTPAGIAPATKGGLGREPQAAPREREQGGNGATPSPVSPPPPTGPQAAGAPAPTPRGRGDDPPSPQQDRGAREGGRSRDRPHAPAACSRRNDGEQANPRQRARAPHGPRPETASEHEPEPYGGHALYGQSDASDTRFVACPGKAEGGTEAGRSPAPLAPPAAQSEGTAHRLPPPPTPPPGAGTPRTRRPSPRGVHSPKPGRGETGPGRAPTKQAKRSTGPAQDTRRGTDRVERPYQRAAPQCARCARHTNHGRGGGTPRERERTHTQRTRGEYQKGNRTEPAERTDRIEWRTSEGG